MPFDTYSVGSISINTRLDLQGYERDKRKLITDAAKVADSIAQRFSDSISGSFSGAGRGLADSLTRDFPRQGLQIQNSLGGTITGAILRANFATAIASQIVGGVTRAGSLIARPLQDIVSTITGAIGQGLDFGNAARIRTEVLSTASALSGVAKVSFEEAEGAIESLNQSLAASAAALPGSTNAFLQVARQVSDEIARVAVDAEGVFDPQRWEEITSRLATSATVLGESSGVNAGLTAMGLSRALSGSASLAELRNLNLFQNNPTLLSEIERQLAEIGAESLRDVTAEGRVNILQAAFDTVVTDDLIAQASNSAEGLIESFRSRLGDPTTGLFSISRDLAGGTSVFDELTNTLRITIGEGEGLLDQLISSAERAGLTLTDPMESLRSLVLRVNEAIARLAENTDAFFQSGVGATLVDIVTTIQARVPQAFGFLTELGGRIIPVVVDRLNDLRQIASSVFGAIADAVALARDYALSLFDSFRSTVDLGGFFEGGQTALEGFNQLVERVSGAIASFVSENRETILGVGQTLGSIFGSGVSAIGDLVGTAQRTLVPVLQQAGELLGGVFSSIWDGLRPLREWFASGETREFLGYAVEGLGRIGEILIQVVGDGLIRTLDTLDKIFVQSGLLEVAFRAVGAAVQIIATGIGGILQLIARWDELTSAVSGSFSAIVEMIRLRLREALNNVINLVSDRFGPAVEFVQDIFSRIVETIQDIWQWLDRTLGISERLAGPFEVVKNIAQEIVEFISNMFGGLQRILGLGGQAQQGQAFQPGGAQPSGGFVSPIQGQSLQQTIDYQQSQGQSFTASRRGRNRRFHGGIDIGGGGGAGVGAIIQSVTDGVVSEIREIADSPEGLGASVQVRVETTDVTGQTVQQRYTHLSRQAVEQAGIQVGSQVRAGQILGRVGPTDTVSTGAHLDYKVTINGQFVDPDEFLSLAGAAGTLSTLNISTGQRGQVNVGAIAPQRPAGGLGGRLASAAGLGAGALQVDPVYSGLLQRFQGDRTIASAFYGNFVQESGLDTTAVNAIGASGLAQWLGSRREELQDFADQMGKEWTDLDVQLDFVLRELETSESAAWQKIREAAATGDVAATTRAVRQYYERPGADEARDDRRIAAAQQAFQQGGAGTAVPGALAPPGGEVGLQQFLDPTQRAQRELTEAQRVLGREAQLRSQARQDEDRVRQLEREQREDALRAQQAELGPRDIAGSAIIDAQIRALQIADQISDRILQNERNITDLVDARELQQRQQTNLEAQRTAFEQAIATGGATSVTEEDLRKLESEISPIDFDQAIANLQQYGEELDTLRADKLRPIQASLSQFATQAIEDSRRVLQSVEQLNQQYGEPSAFEQHQAAIESLNIAYEENGRNLAQTIGNLEQLQDVENLSEEQYALLAERLEQATQAQDNLSAAQERAIALANETYEAQQRLATINLVEQLLAPQLRAAEAEAQAIERFDQFGANVIRRQTAIATMATRFAEEIEAANTQTAQLIRQFEQAQAVGDQATLDRFQALGIGGVEDIQAIAEQNREAVEQVYATELQMLSEQFPTVAEAFRNSLRDATSQGLTDGFRGLATGQLGIGDFFGNLLTGLYDTVISAGSQRLSDFLTGGLFGNGQEGGLLDGLFGANEPLIPGAQEATGILEQGGIALEQRMIDGARSAANILANVGLGGGATGPVGGDLDVVNFGQTILPGVFGGGDVGGVGGVGGAGGVAIPSADDLLSNAGTFGTIVAEGFAEKMPEAGNALAGGRGQGFIGRLIQGVGGLFGGGGGSGGGSGGVGSLISGLFGALGGLFNEGGLVQNYAAGGITGAMTRERLASGRVPRLGVFNDGEYVFSSPAVERIGVGKLDAMNFGGYIPNFAIGGAIASNIGIIDPPIHGQYQVPIQTNTRPQRIEYKFQSEVINSREYVSRDQLDLLEQRVNEAPAQGAQAAIEALRSSPSTRARAGF